MRLFATSGNTYVEHLQFYFTHVTFATRRRITSSQHAICIPHTMCYPHRMFYTNAISIPKASRELYTR